MADCKDMPIYIDALDFEETARTGLKKQDFWLMIRACRLYQGEFLPKLTGEKWVSDIAIEYQRLYFNCLRAVAGHLKGLGEYEKLLDLCAKTCELYPYEEFEAMKIDCLMELRLFREAMTEYEQVVARCSEEGFPISRQMLNRFRILSGHVGYTEESLGQIIEYFRDEGAQDGAMYCGYPSFLDCCRMAERLAGGRGLGCAVLCCTALDSRGFPMRGERPEEKAASLKREDVYTCCSFGRYLILLNGAGREEAKAAGERIREAFEEAMPARRGTVDCRILKLTPAAAGQKRPADKGKRLEYAEKTADKTDK